MENSSLKKLLPHAISFVVMVVLALIFFAPYIFDDKVLNQHDNIQAAASQSEMEKTKLETGKAPLWTNAYFSGMPTFQIHFDAKGNLTVPIFRLLMAGQPMTSPFSEILLAMLCMYLLLTVMRLDWRISLLGAIVFGFSTFNMDIIAAGHSTKMVALAFAPAVIGSAILAFRGKYMLGAALFALFTAMQIYANHYQITYYTFLIVAVLGISELINAIRQKTPMVFGKAALSLAAGLLFAALTNLTTLWTTMEYQAESTRGKTELSAASKMALQTKQGQSASSNPDGGLSKDYAFGWSYGIGESMTLLVQNAYGGGASQNMTNVNKNLAGALYMGNQPFVGVAIYYGAVIIFLFFLGIQLVDTRWRWGILAASLLTLGIAWGNNSPIATTFYDILPLFNKFRAHTQALGLGQLLFALMAMLALNQFLDPSVSKEKKQRALLIAAGVSVALCVVSMMGSFTSTAADGRLTQQIKRESPQVTAQQLSGFLTTVHEARAEVAKSDAIISVGLILAAAGLLLFLLRGVISKSWIVVAGIGLLCFGDAWTASRRVIYEEKFQSAAKAQEEAKPAPVDEIIMKDKDLSFRVLDLRKGFPFENAGTSMFHKSVGGYHAAKMLIYQEMVERYLGSFQQNQQGELIVAEESVSLYGMLNAKYVIRGNGMNGLQVNPTALGNAWFVKTVKVVDNADQELEAVGTINPRFETVVQKKHADAIGLTTPQYDSTATIKMTAYNPDKLEYESSAKSDQVAVFSEIYYPMEKGWNLTIDGQPAKFGKANYILRAAKIPAGNHKIVMEFHPKSYYSGETFSMIASALLLLGFIGGLFLYFRKNGLPATDLLPEQPVVAQVERKATPSVSKPITTVAEKPKPTMRKKK